MKQEYSYKAQTNLEYMQEAENYNNYQCDFILKEISKITKKNIKVMDFGAGIGTFAEMLRNKAVNVDCVEIDKTETKVLESKGFNVYSSINQVKDKYDVIYSLNVLEHIEDDKKTLSDLKNCLSDQGVIVIFVPAFNIIFTKLDVIADHFRRYRVKDLRILANKTQMNLKARYCDPIGFFGALVYRIIGGSGTLSPREIYFFDKFLFPFSVTLEKLSRNIVGKNILAVFSKK